MEQLQGQNNLTKIFKRSWVAAINLENDFKHYEKVCGHFVLGKFKIFRSSTMKEN